MKNAASGEVLRWIVGAVVVSLMVRSWLVMGFVDPVTVAGESMQPTLELGQRILVDRTAYLFRTPDRWDVVVFRCPPHADQLCVKRVAGLPGETLELRDGNVHVDGWLELAPPQRLRYEVRHTDRAVLQRRVGLAADQPLRWQLGPDEYFVLGDNANVSEDSRNWLQGPGLESKFLVGKALAVR